MNVNLVLLKKSGSHKIFPLPSTVTVIGRRHSCDLCIPLISVSRKHCQLNSDDGTLKIRDLSSRNGTYLNDKHINDEAAVQAGDSIKIGPLTFVLQIDGQPPLGDVLRQKTIAETASAEQSSSHRDAATENSTTDELSDNFEELDGLDSLDETGSA